MTKKHFVAFAKYIRDRRNASVFTTTEARAMADMVIAIASADNPLFNRDRFLEYCGLEEEG